MCGETSKSAPSASYGRFICANCAEPFTRTHHRQGMFCKPACQKAFHNRNTAVGRTAFELMKAMRLARSVKGKTPEADELRAAGSWAFGELCRLADAANAEDRKAGRPGALRYVRSRVLADAGPEALTPRPKRAKAT